MFLDSGNIISDETFCTFGNFFHHNFDSVYRMSHQKLLSSCCAKMCSGMHDSVRLPTFFFIISHGWISKGPESCKNISIMQWIASLLQSVKAYCIQSSLCVRIAGELWCWQGPHWHESPWSWQTAVFMTYYKYTHTCSCKKYFFKTIL